MEKQIRVLLDTIAIIVKTDGNYRDKLEQILAKCDESDRTNLEEFAAWLDEVNW